MDKKASTPRERLIGYNIPLAEISEASAREKHIRHGHPSALHADPLSASYVPAPAAP